MKEKTKSEKVNLSYEQAFEELQTICNQIEAEHISVDIIADKLKRASELLFLCQEKLKNTETEVNQIIKNLDNFQDKN